MKRRTQVLLAIVSFCVLIASCTPAGLHPPPVQITADSVGVLDLTATLEALLHRHGTVRDTVHGAYPALVFTIGQVAVTGVQARMDDEDLGRGRVRLDCPADYWIIEGSGGDLPGDVAIDASWEEFTRAYGKPTIWSNRSIVGAQFEYLPDWGFHLTLLPEQLGGLTSAQDSVAVLREARIQRVMLPMVTDESCRMLPR
jgi:hypothetical protein